MSGGVVHGREVIPRSFPATALDYVTTAPVDGNIPAYDAASGKWRWGAPGAGSFVMTTVEVNLGSTPKKSGKFTVSGVGLTPNAPVLMVQAVGAATGKSPTGEEPEWDPIAVAAIVKSTTQIVAYWTAPHLVRGFFLFDYVISA